MNEWIDSGIKSEIKKICDLISQNNFDSLDKDGYFEVSAASDVKRAILEYLCGDILNEDDLSRINSPDDEYIKIHANILNIDPKAPSEKRKKIELNLILDGAESDMTIIYFAYKNDTDVKVRVYDALTL